MTETPQVTIVDVRIPFWSMVVLMVKCVLAAIPAMFLLTLIGFAMSAAFGVAILGVPLTSTFTPAIRPAPLSRGTATHQSACRDACDAMGKGADCYADCE